MLEPQRNTHTVPKSCLLKDKNSLNSVAHCFIEAPPQSFPTFATQFKKENMTFSSSLSPLLDSTSFSTASEVATMLNSDECIICLYL